MQGNNHHSALRCVSVYRFKGYVWHARNVLHAVCPGTLSMACGVSGKGGGIPLLYYEFAPAQRVIQHGRCVVVLTGSVARSKLLFIHDDRIALCVIARTF